MHKIDMRSETTVAFGISATLSGTTPSAGNIVDVADYQAATFLFQTGTVTDAGDATGFTVAIQESDTTAAADFTAVADADLIGLETALTVTSDASDGIAVGCVGYRGSKRYIRAVVTGSTGTNAVVNGVWALQKPRYAPKGDAAINIAAT
ncbi:hypothetical protein [Gemmobacter denitrificans]|uniref:Bacteriophage lambda head decoration protein D n=1 Tax=Gemmobacter denitrificans TaxID=3123040 RepID=A0ABU8BQX5_9RHOB